MAGSRRPIVGKVFLNYRRDDTGPESRRLYDEVVEWLDANGGDGPHQTFRDIDSIPPTSDFRVVLDGALRASGVFIALVGPRWLDITDDSGRRRLDSPNDPVRLEIEMAIPLAEKGSLVPVTLLVRGAKVPAAQDLPPSMAAFSVWQAFPVRGGALLTQDIQQHLKRHLGRWTATVVERKSGLLRTSLPVFGRPAILRIDIALTHATHTFRLEATNLGNNPRLRIWVDGEQVASHLFQIGGEMQWPFTIRDGPDQHEAIVRTWPRGTDIFGRVEVQVSGKRLPGGDVEKAKILHDDV